MEGERKKREEDAIGMLVGEDGMRGVKEDVGKGRGKGLLGWLTG